MLPVSPPPCVPFAVLIDARSSNSLDGTAGSLPVVEPLNKVPAGVESCSEVFALLKPGRIDDCLTFFPDAAVGRRLLTVDVSVLCSDIAVLMRFVMRSLARLEGIVGSITIVGEGRAVLGPGVTRLGSGDAIESVVAAGGRCNLSKVADASLFAMRVRDGEARAEDGLELCFALEAPDSFFFKAGLLLCPDGPREVPAGSFECNMTTSSSLLSLKVSSDAESDS